MTSEEGVAGQPCRAATASEDGANHSVVVVNMPAAASQPPGVTFNYEGVDAAVAERAREIVDRIRARLTASYIETGRDLIKAQELLGHGRFGAWLRANFDMTDRSARRYMSAARLEEANPDSVSVLPPGIVYRLASPNVTDPVRDALLARAAASETIGGREVRDALEADKSAREKELEEQAEQQRLARLTPEGRKRSLKTKAERKRQHDLEMAEHAQREVERKEAAREAVALLVDRLGGDLSGFLKFYRVAGWSFDQALRDLASGVRQ